MPVSISDADFYAPLKSSLLLERGVGLPTFSRSTSGTVFDNEGKLITVPANVPRFRGARMVRNLLTATATLSTQNVTTVATVYVISFTGTGTLSFSGTYAGADLVGDGVTRVQRTFTATAGTLTITVTGSVTDAQLEDVTGQADQTASEYVSVGTLSAPYHGANVDGIKWFNTHKDGSLISDSILLGINLNAFGKTNTLLWNRDLTNAVWVKVNATAALTQTGIDGKPNSCTLLTATGTDATILQTLTLAATNASTMFYVKRGTGTGTISFTRNGGTTWTDITNLINSNTFSVVKIESNSVLNPAIGFKISVSGDSIIVDYGQNETGTNSTNPIYTTSSSNNRAADSLSYVSGGNISDTEGSIIATLYKDNWGVMAGSVVGDTTGLYLTTAPAVQARDGTNTITGNISQVTGARKIGITWSGSTFKVFENIDFTTTGSYDGSLGLTSIKIYSGASGIIKDVGIWLTALPDEDFKSVILNNSVDGIIKNTNSECTLLLNAEGGYYVSAPNLVSKITKNVNIESGSNIITLTSGDDNVGIVVGGRVYNTDLTVDALVTNISGRTITIDTNATATLADAQITFEGQVPLESSYINISEINFSCAPSQSIKIKRGSALIYSLYNTSNFDLKELRVADTSGTGISVDMPANSTLELRLKKDGNWGNNNSSYGNI